MLRWSLIGLQTTVLLAGCTSVSRPQGEPSTPPAVSSAVLSAVVDDPPGTATCALLADAIGKANLMQDGIVDGIVAASSTADAPVADAAQRLAGTYRTAVEASGQASEPDAIADVSAAAADMSSVCADSGLRTVG